MRQLIFLVAIVCLCGSCTHYYYMPNQHNVPLFHEKNEWRASGAYTIGDAAKGLEVQGAYSVTKNVAVMANLCIINPYKGAGGTGRLYEAGAGYYKPFARFLVFENYGVVGIGHANGVFTGDSMPSEYANAGFFKLYDQPSLGFCLFDFLDVAVSEKIGFLDFFRMNGSPAPIENSNVADDINLVTSNRTPFFIEPALTGRVGFKWFKLNAQVGYTFLSNDMRERSGRWDFNIGLLVSVAERFKKK